MVDGVRKVTLLWQSDASREEAEGIEIWWMGIKEMVGSSRRCQKLGRVFDSVF